tara:strand:- start:69 stop:329 length:261 start_codon:yes stop_codon:yes gene_type:complete
MDITCQDFVLVEDTEQKQTHHGQTLVSTQMHIVDVQHTTTAKCMLFLTTQVGQQQEHIVSVIHKKCTKVLRQLLAVFHLWEIETVG